MRTGGGDLKKSITPLTQFLESPYSGKAIGGMDRIAAIFKNSINLGELELIQARATEQIKLHSKALSHMVQYNDVPLVRYFSGLKL